MPRDAGIAVQPDRFRVIGAADATDDGASAAPHAGRSQRIGRPSRPPVTLGTADCAEDSTNDRTCVGFDAPIPRNRHMLPADSR
jgi:hypothetical protein